MHYLVTMIIIAKGIALYFCINRITWQQCDNGWLLCL